MAADSTSMTIDFLRARLLSERSVSRASRERADQLAKRVVELEEQLRIVINQRKNAEKAATEVLSILESQGFGYLTEPELVDSSSDQDEDLNTSPITKECEFNSNFIEKDDDVAKSESPPAGSLSWKGRSKSPDSHKKNNNYNNKSKQLRQRQRRVFYFTSPDPSPKYQLGKSCRKIKPSIRSGADQEERENSRCSTDSNNNENNKNENENGEKNEEMEKALKEQANLIGQFEEEEIAQREWEKLYNETLNTSIEKDTELENRESGEEKGFEDMKEIVEKTESETTECTDENSSHDTKEITENIESENRGENSFGDKKEIMDYTDEKSEQIDEPKFNSEILSSNGSTTEKYDHEITDTSFEKAIVVVPNYQNLNESNSESKYDQNHNESNYVSHSNNEDSNPLALQLYHPPVDKVSNVLEALKRAKISLWENLSKKKLREYKYQEILAITEHGEQNTDINTQHIINIPVSNSECLFRLPTVPCSDFSNSVLNLEYSKDLMNRFSNEDYFDSRNAKLALHDSFSSSNSNNNQIEFGSNSRFHEDLRRRIPAADRHFLYGGNCSFDDMDM